MGANRLLLGKRRMRQQLHTSLRESHTAATISLPQPGSNITTWAVPRHAEQAHRGLPHVSGRPRLAAPTSAAAPTTLGRR